MIHELKIYSHGKQLGTMKKNIGQPTIFFDFEQLVNGAIYKHVTDHNDFMTNDEYKQALCSAYYDILAIYEGSPELNDFMDSPDTKLVMDSVLP